MNEALWAKAKTPRGVQLAAPAESRKAERFTRKDDEEQEFSSQRVREVVERISLEDQTLIGGLPAEAVLDAASSGYADCALVREVTAFYGSKKELEAVPEYEDSPLYWDLHGSRE